MHSSTRRRRPIVPASKFAAAALLLALSACSESNNPYATFWPAPPVPFRGDASWYNGSYQGYQELVRASIPGCPRSRQGVLEIGDRTLYLPYAPDLFFVVPVQSDGALHGAAGTSTLDGRIFGRHLDLTVTTAACQSRYDMDMVWNRG
jgi:hypothetical protein